MPTSTRFLIIEDNRDDENLLLRQLRKAKLEDKVRVINDGERALDYLRNPGNKAEDLVAIFLDLKLPIRSGMDILEAIRADKRLAGLSVILMTSSNVKKELDRCRELGVSAYVQKPVSFTAFAKAVSDTSLSRKDAGGTPRAIE